MMWILDIHRMRMKRRWLSMERPKVGEWFNTMRN